MDKSRMYLGTRSLLSLTFGLLLVVTSSAQQVPPLKYRVWTDKSGDVKIEAAMIVLKDGTVYLEAKDGKVFSAPLSRFSEADQEYAKADAGKNTTQVIDRSQLRTIDPREALVLVQRQDEDRRINLPGLLIQANDEWGYVATVSNANSVRPGRITPVAFRVLLFPGTKRQRTIDAEPASNERRHNVCIIRMRAEKLPRSPARSPAELEEGQGFSVIGLENFRDEADCQIGFRKATVKKLRKGDDGTVIAVELAGLGIDELTASIVIDEKNQLVGFAQGVRSRSPTDKATMTTAKQISDMWTPTLSLRAEPVVWNRQGMSTRLEGGVSDPFGRIDQMVLEIARLGETAPRVERLGRAWHRAADDLVLVKVERGERGVVQPIGGALWKEQEPLPSDAPLKYVAQLAVTTEQGVVYCRPLIVEPTFLGRQWGPALEILGAVRETAQPHPDGGLLLTSAKSQTAATELPAAKSDGDFPQPKSATAVYLKENLQIDRAPVRRHSSDHEKLGTWADGGEAFLYADQGTNTVRRLSVPEFKAEVEVSFDESIIDMALAKDCLLVLTGSQQQPGLLWGLAPRTLKVLWSREATRGTLSATRSNPLALVTQFDRTKLSLMVLDTARGKPLHLIDEFRRPMGKAIITPNGKQILIRSNDALVRLRLDGSNLILEESTAEIKPYGATLSPGGDILAARIDTARIGRSDHPKFGRGMYFYNPSDLSKPAFGFALPQTNPYVFTIGLASRRIFTLQPDLRRRRRDLKVFSLDGELLHQLENVEADTLYVHPDNNRLLGNYKDQFTWINLPDHVLRDRGLAIEDDPAEVTERLINLLGWTIEELPHEAVEKQWKPLTGGGRAAKIPGRFPITRGFAWSPDGKFLYFRDERVVTRFSLEKLSYTHRLTIPYRFGDHMHSDRLAMCPRGLLVRDDKRLLLVDPKTLRPIKVVFDKLQYGNRFLAGVKSPHLVRVQYVHNVNSTVSTVDLETGKALDRWSLSHDDAKKRAMLGLTFVQLSPDGRHFFCGGRATLHLAINEQGEIEPRPDVVMAGGATAMPLPPAAPGAMAFHTLGSRSFICNTSDLTKPVMASEDNTHWIFDPVSSLYWNVAKSGDIVGYDAAAKEKFRLKDDELIDSLRRMDVHQIATAPPGGGSLVLLAKFGAWWVDLPKK